MKIEAGTGNESKPVESLTSELLQLIQLQIRIEYMVFLNGGKKNLNLLILKKMLKDVDT